MPIDGKIHFRCPHCDRAISVAEAHAGKRSKCPACGQAIQVPEPEPVPDFDTLLEQSMAELRLKTEAHDGTWQLGKCDWDIDQDTGVIIFTSPKKIVATCSVQIIGTLNTKDKTWLWGWDHPSVDPALQKHARICLAYGEKHGIELLTSQKLTDTSEEEGWQFTALACKLADAQGGFRGKMDATAIYVTFGTPRLTKLNRDWN